jgi:hypothetical protein
LYHIKILSILSKKKSIKEVKEGKKMTIKGALRVRKALDKVNP